MTAQLTWVGDQHGMQLREGHFTHGIGLCLEKQFLQLTGRENVAHDFAAGIGTGWLLHGQHLMHREC